MSVRHTWLAVVVSLALSACGGGKSSTPGTSISLDRSSLTFSATRGGASPASQAVAASWVGDGLIVGYPVGVSPASWLGVTLTQSGASSAIATVSVTTGGLLAGTYTTTLRFVTGRQDGSDVKYVDLPVTLTVADTFSAAVADYDFARTWGTATTLQGAPILISTGAKAWHVSAGATWVTLGMTQGTGSATVSVGIDAAAQEPVGTSTTTLTVSADDGSFTKTVNVSLVVTAPTAAVGTASLALVDGTVSPVGTVAVTLSNGARAGTWAATSNASWLKLDTATGTPGLTVLQFHADATGSDVAAGHHQGTIDVRVDVPGASQTVTATIDATISPRVLYVEDNGAALVSRPGLSSLTRTFALHDSTGAVDPTWSATTDQPWLTLTRPDDTHLTVTADPTGLGTAVHLAQVTLSSANAKIAGTERLTVGLTVDATPLVDGAIADASAQIGDVVPDAVRPRFYVFSSGGGTIDVRDAYTGASVRTLTVPSGLVQAVTVSLDGAFLYVEDQAQARIHVYDLGADTWMPDLTIPKPRSGTDQRLGFVRLKGAELLLVGDCFLDARTGAFRGGLRSAAPASCDSLGRYAFAREAEALLVVDLGYSPSGFGRYDLSYDLVTATVSGRSAGGGTAGGNGNDIAVTPDGLVAIPSAGGGCTSYDWCIYEYAAGAYAQAGTLPGDAYPNNVEAGRFGEWYVAMNFGTSSGYDLVVYGANRTLLGGYSGSDLTHPKDDGLRVSADGQRILVATDAYPYGNGKALRLFPALH
jgi:hypothetical protein